MLQDTADDEDDDVLVEMLLVMEMVAPLCEMAAYSWGVPDCVFTLLAASLGTLALPAALRASLLVVLRALSIRVVYVDSSSAVK